MQYWSFTHLSYLLHYMYMCTFNITGIFVFFYMLYRKKVVAQVALVVFLVVTVAIGLLVWLTVKFTTVTVTTTTEPTTVSVYLPSDLPPVNGWRYTIVTTYACVWSRYLIKPNLRISESCCKSRLISATKMYRCYALNYRSNSKIHYVGFIAAEHYIFISPNYSHESFKKLLICKEFAKWYK